MEELYSLYEKLSHIGFPGLLVALLYGSYRGYWVWGKDYQTQIAALKCERDEWKTIALRGTLAAEVLATMHTGNPATKQGA
jgi:hypothetical protein